MTQTTQRVAVTGAAGQIGYALLFRIASGQMFGPGVDVELSMLELEAALPAAEGVRLELDDCAFPLLKSVTISSKPEDAFAGADWALLVGAVPRKQGMERADLLTINGSVFTAQGKAIAKAAKPSCRVLVVGNPCNTNAMICRSSGGLPASQVFAMTMLDQNRAVTQLAQKAGTRVSAVQNLAIWGNHSPTMFPDFLHAKIGGKALTSVVTDRAWLEGRFLETVQQRGAEIIKARGASSAASAANAVVDSVRALTTPTPPGQFFSACVTSDGSYGVPAGLVFGYPLRSDGTNVSIVQGLEHDAYARGKLDKTIAELVGERDAVRSML